MSDTTRSKQEASIGPFPATVDKCAEASYFLAMMMVNYHKPHPFRFNLNAFIQALRNITFLLQNEENRPSGFSEWYQARQAEMRANPLLRNFTEARNVIVKQSALYARSKAQAGLFRRRTMKLAIQGEMPPHVPSDQLLEQTKEFAFKIPLIDKEHSAIGEQIGVKRIWIVDFIGEAEIVGLGATALCAIGEVVSAAHVLVGSEQKISAEIPPAEMFQVLLESDLDPTLPEKWGW